MAECEHESVWTIGTVDVTSDMPIEVDACGTYDVRDEATDACAALIVERIGLRPDIRYALMHDVNHPWLPDAVAARCCWDVDVLKARFTYSMDDGWELPSEVGQALTEVLEDQLRMQTGYDIATDVGSDIGAEQFLFFVHENLIHRGEAK